MYLTLLRNTSDFKFRTMNDMNKGVCDFYFLTYCLYAVVPLVMVQNPITVFRVFDLTLTSPSIPWIKILRYKCAKFKSGLSNGVPLLDHLPAPFIKKQ